MHLLESLRMEGVDSSMRGCGFSPGKGLPECLAPGQTLELAFQIPGAGQAFEGMGGKEQFHGESAGLLHFRRVRMNDQPFPGRENAGGLKISVSFDLYQTYPAGADRLYFGEVAQGGDANVGGSGRF